MPGPTQEDLWGLILERLSESDTIEEIQEALEELTEPEKAFLADWGEPTPEEMEAVKAENGSQLSRRRKQGIWARIKAEIEK